MLETRYQREDERAFDFLMGDWIVAHRRLSARLVGSSDWQEFSGTCSARPVLGGRGNLDDNDLDFPGGSYRAVTLRTFDRATRRWSIWWLDGRHPHRLDPPVVGRFQADVGTFYADDFLADQPIRVRFRWTGTTTDSPAWEQAFSSDGGDTWEVNWTMRFERPSGSGRA